MPALRFFHTVDPAPRGTIRHRIECEGALSKTSCVAVAGGRQQIRRQQLCDVDSTRWRDDFTFGELGDHSASWRVGELTCYSGVLLWGQVKTAVRLHWNRRFQTRKQSSLVTQRATMTLPDAPPPNSRPAQVIYYLKGRCHGNRFL